MLTASRALQPLVCVSALAPLRFSEQKPLQHARLLRIQLAHLRDFVLTCRQRPALEALLQGRTHLMDNTVGERSAARLAGWAGGALRSRLSSARESDASGRPCVCVCVLARVRGRVQEMYSLQDLAEVAAGSLGGWLMSVVQQLALHVSRDCQLCAARGSCCELCTDRRPIFPFEIMDTAQCRDCNALFHRRCFDGSRCPKCDRLRARRRKDSASAAAE